MPWRIPLESRYKGTVTRGVPEELACWIFALNGGHRVGTALVDMDDQVWNNTAR